MYIPSTVWLIRQQYSTKHHLWEIDWITIWLYWMDCIADYTDDYYITLPLYSISTQMRLLMNYLWMRSCQLSILFWWSNDYWYLMISTTLPPHQIYSSVPPVWRVYVWGFIFVLYIVKILLGIEFLFLFDGFRSSWYIWRFVYSICVQKHPCLRVY